MSAGGINARSARDLFDGGEPLPGKITRNHEGELIFAGFTASDLPFGRIVPRANIQDDNTRLYREIDETDTLIDGVAVYSFDAIAAQDECKYSDGEPVGVMSTGFVILESYESIDLNSLIITFKNGENSGDEGDIGKIGHTTGVGFSNLQAINVQLTRKISDTLVEVFLDGAFQVVPGT